MKNKLQIMKNRPSISDEEIRSYMNFDSVVNEYETRKKSNSNRIRNASWLLGIVGIAFLTYFFWPEKPTSTTSNAPLQEVLPITNDSAQSEIQLSPIATDNKNSEQEPVTNKSLESRAAWKIKETAPIVKEELVTPAFQYLEAEPASGYPALYDYFARELRYPAEALKDSIQGIVSVSFLIDKEGKPVQIKIVNSLGTAFDKEAQRLIENMPTWRPATLNGKPVAAKISLPFTFQIVKTNPEKK
jgi:TonB family protein